MEEKNMNMYASCIRLGNEYFSWSLIDITCTGIRVCFLSLADVQWLTNSSALITSMLRHLNVQRLSVYVWEF